MNTATSIQTSIWEDGNDFRRLSTHAKFLYLTLLTQPKVSICGALDVSLKRWSALTSWPADDVAVVLGALEGPAEFVWVDYDTDELVIRTWVKHNVKSVKQVKGAQNQFQAIDSLILRRKLQVEYPAEFGCLSVPGIPSPRFQEYPISENAEGDSTSTSIQSQSKEVVSKEATSRERNDVWQGLVEVFGYSPRGSSERGLWGKLSKELCTMGATRSSIVEAGRRYSTQMPGVERTPPALVKHYERLMNGHPKAPRSKAGRALQLAQQEPA